MGWTSTDARFYTESGKVDRKAECDNLYTWENEKTKTEVLKSAMKGAIYYAAVRTTDKTSGNSEVWAAVCITSTRNDEGFNFGYKSMSEDCGPFYCDCPKSILALLTDTDNEYAKEWREKCWANIRTPKKSLASVKIGEIIEFELRGETIRAEKMAPAYQFKTPWFKRVGKDVYIKKNHIKDWVVVQAEAQQPATPAETPHIASIEIVRDFDGSYYANLTDTSGDYHTLSAEYVSYNKLKSLCRAEYDVELPKCSSLKFKKHGRKEFAYYTPQGAETPQISTETAETVNVSGESEKEPEMAKYRFTQNEIDEMKQQILGECEFNATALEKGYKKVFPEMGEYSALNIRRSYEGYINEFKEGSKNRKFYERRLALYELLTENDRPNFIQQTPPEPAKEPRHLPQPPKFAPKSPQNTRTANYATPTLKAREIARKRHCRSLGANGYAMLDDAAATLAAINTPQRLTANAPPIGRPQLTPYW